MRYADNDGWLLCLWRDAASEVPGELLDRRIIKWAWRAVRERPDSWR